MLEYTSKFQKTRDNSKNISLVFLVEFHVYQLQSSGVLAKKSHLYLQNYGNCARGKIWKNEENFQKYIFAALI